MAVNLYPRVRIRVVILKESQLNTAAIPSKRFPPYGMNAWVVIHDP